jgi:hypothetical protein
MKLHALVKLVFIIFCVFELKLLAENINNYPIVLVSVLFVAIIMSGGFWFEVRISKSAFHKLFQDEIIPANQEDAPGQNAAR